MLERTLPDGTVVRVATDPHELPWFNDVLAKAKADLLATPREFLPAWGREWRDRQERPAVETATSARHRA